MTSWVHCWVERVPPRVINCNYQTSHTIIIYDPTIYEVDPSMIRNPGLNDNLGLTLDYHLLWILPPAKCDATISNRHPNHVGSDWGTIWQSIERRQQFCTSPANRGKLMDRNMRNIYCNPIWEETWTFELMLVMFVWTRKTYWCHESHHCITISRLPLFPTIRHHRSSS